MNLICLIFGHKIDQDHYRPIIRKPATWFWPVQCNGCKKFYRFDKIRLRHKIDWEKIQNG